MLSTHICLSPVEKYFNYAMQEGQPYISKALITQQGELRLGKKKKWMPFEAKQYISVDPRESSWDAAVKIAPLIRLHVRDGYASGKGSTELRLFSIPFSKESDSKQLTAAALQRYLGESVWFPTALLPGKGVKWKPLNDTTALATLRDEENEASLYFHFNDQGEIVCVSTEGRYRKVGENYELTPWKVRTQSFEEIDGFRIPTEVEVDWQFPEDDFCWYRVKIIDVQYEFDAQEKVGPFFVVTSENAELEERSNLIEDSQPLPIFRDRK
jgi:hypothetical protein